MGLRRAAVVAALALAACVATPLPPVSPEARVTLRSGPCFGLCPAYRVTVDARDVAVFEGERHVPQRGRHERPLPAGTLALLLRDLEELGVFELAPSYTHGTKNCGAFATDHPTLHFEVKDGRRTIAVEHDTGCRGAPGRLQQIEALIEERSGARHWLTQAPES